MFTSGLKVNAGGALILEGLTVAGLATLSNGLSVSSGGAIVTGGLTIGDIGINVVGGLTVSSVVKFANGLQLSNGLTGSYLSYRRISCIIDI